MLKQNKGGDKMGKQYNVDMEIISFAMRHAFGKSSSTISSVVENIKHNLSRIDNKTLSSMIGEIECYSKDSNTTDFGKWSELQALLQEVLLIRETFNMDSIGRRSLNHSSNRFEYVLNVLEGQANNPTDIYSSKHDIGKVLSEAGVSSKNKTMQECYKEMSVAVAARKLQEDIKNKE